MLVCFEPLRPAGSTRRTSGESADHSARLIELALVSPASSLACSCSGSGLPVAGAGWLAVSLPGDRRRSSSSRPDVTDAPLPRAADPPRPLGFRRWPVAGDLGPVLARRDRLCRDRDLEPASRERVRATEPGSGRRKWRWHFAHLHRHRRLHRALVAQRAGRPSGASGRPQIRVTFRRRQGERMRRLVLVSVAVAVVAAGVIWLVGQAGECGSMASCPAIAEVGGEAYVVGVVRGIDVEDADLVVYGEIERANSRAYFLDDVVYALCDVDAKALLLVRATPGLSDDGGTWGPFVGLFGGGQDPGACRYFVRLGPTWCE